MRWDVWVSSVWSSRTGDTGGNGCGAGDREGRRFSPSMGFEQGGGRSIIGKVMYDDEACGVRVSVGWGVARVLAVPGRVGPGVRTLDEVRMTLVGGGLRDGIILPVSVYWDIWGQRNG